MSAQYEYDRQVKIPDRPDLQINIPSTIHSLICLCGAELPVTDAPGTHTIRCKCGEIWGISNLPKPVDLKKREPSTPGTPSTPIK